MSALRSKPSWRDVLLTVAVSAVSTPQTFFYGGQAVIEGVLMRGRTQYAVAARNRAGEIVVFREHLRSSVYTSPVWRLPFLRGVAGLIETLHLGFRAIQWSANVQLGEDVELTPRMMRMTVAGSIIFALLLFIGGPALGQSLVHHGSAQRSVSAVLLEGVFRALILIAYLLIMGQIPSMKRLFGYHGAEHKAINCLESGRAVVVPEVRTASRLHPRCGTGFLVLVALVSIVVFAPLAPLPMVLRLAVQILLVPLVASLAYELIRILARIRNTIPGKIALAPVLATQLLSTRTPDDSQIEVAIAALDAARGIDGGDVSEGGDPVTEH